MASWLHRHRLDLLIIVVTLSYRLFLTSIYYGWEESDYGNLAMARGVLDSGFTSFDMRHLPLYYAAAAAVLAVVGDTILATHLVSICSGVCLVWASWRLTRHLFDETTGLVAATLLIFQPGIALYSSSSLREPFYGNLLICGLLLTLTGRPWSGALATGGAFLTRFDAMFTAMPPLLLHPMSLGRPGWRRVAGAAAIFGLCIGGWSLYCGQVHGDYVFFRSTVEVNVATGGAQEIQTRWDFIHHGLEVVLGMCTHLLPRMFGWPLIVAALAAFPLWGRRIWRQRDLRTFVLAGILNTGFWFATAFAAQHEWNHNLYWKWMFSLTIFWCIAAAFTAVWCWRRLDPRQARVLALVATVWTGVTFTRETHAQVEESDRLYRPQVELARWVEEQVPDGTTLIFDNIPMCYANRRHHGLHFLSWFDIQLEEGNPDSLGALITAENIRYILWFREDWTVAPRLAPYLAEEAEHQAGPWRLVPRRSEAGYGWIFYEVLPETGQGRRG